MKKYSKNRANYGLFGPPATAVNSETLNPEQKQAAEAPTGEPLLIVAGAGTGKTKTLTRRIAHFIELGGGVEKVCAITFTNKAAREIEARVGNIGEGHFLGTFHSLGARILRKHATLLGRTTDFVIFDENDSFALVKKILKDIGAKKESPAIVRNNISDRKNLPLDSKEKKVAKAKGEDEDQEKRLEEIFLRYEQALRAANAFDFDDLLHKTVLAISAKPELKEKYGKLFRHVLVDEYQDVNPIQYELVKLLAGGGASLSVVGDAEQTIYGWRGSDIGIFLRFPDEWHGANMITLTQNYRSTGNILRAAGGVIANNEYDTKVKRAVDLWTENGEGEPVTLYEAYDEDSEAEWIANNILMSPEMETGILYRTNMQSRALEQALLRRRIPYRVYGGLKFYERREIKDVVAGVRWALNPNDELSWDRLDKTFPKKTCRAIQEAFGAMPGGVATAAPAELVETFLAATDYLDLIERTMTNPRERVENIQELLKFATEFPESARFLEEITLLQAADDLGKNRGRAREEQNVKVNLMTVHLAKGLEFDRVFVAGCTEGLLPHARSVDNKDQLQEERRLMYVAMTRARKKLFLSFYGIPSRFLGEIPEDVLRFESMGSGDSVRQDLDDEERYISLD